MKVRVIAKITISANRSEVFKYLSNLKYHFLWNPHLRSITPQCNVKLGTTYESASLLLGVRIKALNIVTKLLQDKELELHNKTGTIQYAVNYKLQEINKKTKLICITSVSSENEAFAFTEPVLKLLARRELQSDLKALKIAVEQRLG